MSEKYTMRISRLTIDKLGIQMYDRVSAVLAELMANCYDADAEHVTIALPLGRYLAEKDGDGVRDLGYEIRIEDDGSGMKTSEVHDYYLQVGFNRRTRRSEVTPKNRRVMGRKGIGKLAPFGICREVEVVTSGGEPDEDGYEVSNLILELDRILEDTRDEEGKVEDYHPKVGPLDGTRRSQTGTTVILRNFDRRRVPAKDDLHRQLAAGFGLTREDWNVTLIDSTGESDSIQLGTLQVDLMEGTLIQVDERPVKVEEDKYLPVSGWVAYAKDPYKDEVMAGVRIYARGKIVAQTRDFNVKTGFTGEFKMRSYLTGEIHAEWIDEKDQDLIRTDRQDIIWNSERGNAFREWGRAILKELAGRSEASAGRRVWDLFLEKSNLQQRLERALPNDAALRDAVTRAAKSLMTRADRDAMQNPRFVERVVGLAFTVGPHRSLLDTLDEVASSTTESVEAILELFEKARIVEVYSLGQVAQRRVDSVEELRKLVSSPNTVEDQLQKLIERAPWILYADWTPLSFNEPLARTRRNFESWYQANYGGEIVTSSIDNPEKKPDFVMLNHEGRLEVIEIKRPQHQLNDDEFQRAFGYLTAVNKFIADNAEVSELYHEARLTIVCDALNLRLEYASLLETNPQITRKGWHDVLQATNRAHEDFLKVVRGMQGELPEFSDEED